MAYVEGFVIAVPTANREEFLTHARFFDQMLIDEGALRVVECWGDDVPPGKTTDFPGAVKATAEETVCFSWIEWPDKETRTACHEKMAEKMKSGEFDKMAGNLSQMPFDGTRMIFGGFVPILDLGSAK